MSIFNASIKKTLLASAISLSIAAPAAHAGKVEDLEAMMIQMQAQMDQMRAELSEAREQAAHAHEAASNSSTGAFAKGVSVSGFVDVQATSGDDFAGVETEDLAVAEAGLAIEFGVNDNMSGLIALLYEEGANANDSVVVDEATLTWAFTDSPASITVGRTYAFGAYETNMVSDPLTLDLGETQMSLARLDIATESGFAAGAYLFNGDSEKAGQQTDALDHYGFDVGYGMESGDMALAIGFGYISNIADTGGVNGAVTAANALASDVPGMTLNANFATGPFNIIGEYTAATEAFNAADLAFRGAGAQPSAWNLEAAYGFEAAGMPASVALGFGGTEEFAGQLAESRIIAALGFEIAEGASLAFEYKTEEDYSVADGGTGRDQDAFTIQVVQEF